ncbi:ATP-binding protein [Pandoraea sp. NPDC090278]|uniref:ATP-binding protein n=1 Tax=Pandoraea sp. NPDC090278 TaxID=3364391 RepID=UPI00383A3F79
MDRYLSKAGLSPLRAIRSLEKSMQREHLMFSFFVSTLIFLIVISAIFVIGGKATRTLRLYEQALWSADEGLSAVVVRRLGMLDTSRLLLRNHGVYYKEHTVHPTSPSICRRSAGSTGSNVVFEEVCNDAASLLATVGGDAPLMIVAEDASLAYSHNFPTIETQNNIRTDDGLRRFVVEISSQMKHLKASNASREPVWMRVPNTFGANATTLIAVLPTDTGGDSPKALLVTSIDVGPFLPSFATSESRGGGIALLDQFGNVLIGSLSTAQAGKLHKQVFETNRESFSQLSAAGWAMRWPSRAFGGDTMVVALPWSAILTILRSGSIWILALAGITIAILFIASRFWRRHFIERTYRQAKHAIERQMLNHLLVHATPIGLCILNKDRGQIVVANSKFRKTLNLSETDTDLPSEFARGFADVVRQSEVTQIGDETEHTVISQFPVSVSPNEGANTHLEITFAPALLNDEDVYFCAVADVTEHIEAERMLRQAKETSEDAARAKLKFFASMSHEIRTPLATLSGNLELMALGDLAEEQRARLHAMQASTGDLLQIVNDVLDFSKIDIGEMPLNRRWQSTLTLFSSIAVMYAPVATRAGVSFYLSLEKTVPAELFLDALRVSQILHNLLSNAFKFTSSGKVTLKISWVDSVLDIVVADSGVGIPEEVIPKLFQPFFQGESHRLARIRGTGLGLSICSRLTALMKGSISVESTVDVGTRVRVVIPFAEDEHGDAMLQGLLEPQRTAVVISSEPELASWLSVVFSGSDCFVHNYKTLPEREVYASADVVIVALANHLVASLIDQIGASKVLELTPQGPLLPTRRESGALEVCTYSIEGIDAALKKIFLSSHDHSEAQVTALSELVVPKQAGVQGVVALIVEDNELNAKLLKDQLSSLNVTTLSCSAGEDALALLHQGQKIDLIITDINLPAMSGYDLLKCIRQTGSSIPVYAISASVQPSDIMRGLEFGFTDYLSKPVPLPRLSVITSESGLVHAETRSFLSKFSKSSEQHQILFISQFGIDLEHYELAMSLRDVRKLVFQIHKIAGSFATFGDSLWLRRCMDFETNFSNSDTWTAEVEAAALSLQDLVTGLGLVLPTPVTSNT